MTYDIVDPEKLYRGKSYSTLIEDWFNWYLSVDADKRTLGPVVFLRSTVIPSASQPNDYKEQTELSITNLYQDDPLYDKPYVNNPHVRVGGDKLQIYSDQDVFVPIIVAYEVARKPYYDWGSMQEFTGLTINYGDNPPAPEQLLIDGQPIKDPLIKNQKDMEKFRIMTPLFPVIIPEADYGRSVKDFLEESFAPGEYLAIVEGYFLLINNFSPGTHRVYSRASAPRERGGPYVAEFLYEITVEKRPTSVPSRGAVQFRPPRNQAIINRILDEKIKKGELTQSEVNKVLADIP
jgi:hypothetical protein